MQFVAKFTRASLNLVRELSQRYRGSECHQSTYQEKYASDFGPLNENPDIWTRVSDIASKARELIQDLGPVRELAEILSGSPNMAASINLRDLSGYSLLQYAIMSNSLGIVKYLVCHGADLNAPMCGRPLHLAAKLGHTEILQMLLDYGADPDVISSVCYPDDHMDCNAVYTEEGKHWSSACVGDLYQADHKYLCLFEGLIYYAIASDNTDCVSLLWQHDVTRLMTRSQPLHVACCLGSLNCVKLFLKLTPKALHVLDKDGYPIQQAVQWGKSFIECLVLNGASLMVNNDYNETLLHILFNQADSDACLAETTAFLLECGLRIKVNAVANCGNSVLNMLLKRLATKPPAIDSSAVQDMDQPRRLKAGGFLRDTSQFDEQLPVHGDESYSETDALHPEEMAYIQCLRLLLEAGANPNISNKVGDTSLLMLVRASRICPGVSPPVSFHLIYEMLLLLLKHGANPNLVSNVNTSVVSLLVKYGCSRLFHLPSRDARFKVTNRRQVNWFIGCLTLLQKHGCRFISPNGESECLLHTAINNIEEIDQLSDGHFELHRCELATEFVRQILAVLHCLLECGYQANKCRAITSDIHALCYNLLHPDSLHLLPMSLIVEGTILMLHHGANPSTGPVIHFTCVPERNDPESYAFHPLLYVLKTLEVEFESERRLSLTDLFHIHYTSTDHNEAILAIKYFLKFHRLSLHSKLLKFLTDLIHNPPSLRHITGTYVYNELAGRSARKLQNMSLPRPLCRLLLGFIY